MGIFSIPGLSSGMDTAALIDKLIAVDSRSKTKYEWNQQLSNLRKNIWSDLKTKLGTAKTAADDLLKFETWQIGSGSGTGSWAAASGDPSRLSATIISGGNPTGGTYNISVQQLAQAEISRSTGNLSGATSGIRSTGVFQKSGGVAVTGTETLTSLRTAANGSTGIGTGSKITMNYSVNGVAHSEVFTVGAGNDGTTLAQLRTWAEGKIGNGASVSWNGGKLQVTTAPGTNNELSDLSFSAVNSSNVALPNFNSLAGASSSQTTTATNGGVLGSETLTITQGSSSWAVSLNAGDQVSDIANKINATSGIGVFASIVGGKLQLQGNDTGSNKAFSISSSGSTASMLNFQETQTAQNLQYSVDGVSHSNNSNFNVTGAIADVSMTFNSLTNTTLTVSQSGGKDPQTAFEDAIIKKVKAFADSYNSILDFVYQKTQAESKVTTPSNKTNGLSLAEYLTGPMARNTQMSGISSQLRMSVNDVVSGLGTGSNMLKDIGISSTFSIGNKTDQGKLVVDEDKLRAAIKADPSAVQNVLTQVGAGPGVSADDGFARRISKMAFDMTGPTGVVGSAIDSASASAKSLQDSIDRAQLGLDRRRKMYERMYANMETMLGKLQDQSNYLSSQLSALQQNNR